MYSILEQTDGSVIGIRVSDKLTTSDIKGLRAYLEQRILDHGDIRLLIHMDEWKGWDSFTAMWEDLKADLRLNKHVERLAMVGEEDFDRWMAQITKPFAKGTVRYFESAHLDRAWAWIHKDVVVEA